MQKRELGELLTELIRIMSAQQRVTIVAEQTGRTSTKGAVMHGPGGEARGHPERLGIPAKPTCSIKFVWPQKLPSAEDPNSKTAT